MSKSKKLMLSSLTSKSRSDFLKEYSKYGEQNKKELFLLILTEIEKTITESDLLRLIKLSDLLDYITKVDHPTTLKGYYENSENSIKSSTNLVVLACKHDNVKILEYLFSNNTTLINNLSNVIKINSLLPDVTDESNHNAFYYAIRSNNIDLLQTIINNWPDNYFARYPEKLDEIISVTYEELKLKNVPLTEETEMYVQNKLINLRFFSSTSREKPRSRSDPSSIKKRIELVVENINQLKAEPSNGEEIDAKFLFTVRCIAKNLHGLKHLTSTNCAKLPWKEIEFCLTSFVSSLNKEREIDLFYSIVLDKSQILKHLDNFGNELCHEKDNLEDVNVKKIAKRKKVVEKINHNKFGELYDDYQRIRDIYCLKKIDEYVKLVLSVDPDKQEGQLVIIRVLQVLSEHLINTLEYPNLSNTASELILIHLPKNTRKIIINLRNSLSDAYSLATRAEIEENTDKTFFINVQNDIKEIDNVVTDILNNYRRKILKTIIEKLVNSESQSEIKEIAEICATIDIEKKYDFEMTDEVKLKKIINELNGIITDQTDYEKEMFNKIIEMINVETIKVENVEDEYTTGLGLSAAFNGGLIDSSTLDNNEVRHLKFVANKMLKHFNLQIDFHDLKELCSLSMKITQNTMLRMRDGNDQLRNMIGDEHKINEEKVIDKINKIIYEIFYITESVTGDVEWIEKLRERFNQIDSFSPVNRPDIAATEEYYDNQLAVKLKTLRNVLNNYGINDKIVSALPCKNSKECQAVIEMLLLDIMSILSRLDGRLENNMLLFLDDSTPLLVGKCLHNHLKHYNSLIDLLPYDPAIAVIFNARKLIAENVIKIKGKIGKLVINNPSILEHKYKQCLLIISNQQKMFTALKEGSLKQLKNSLRDGADIKARSINLWTALHFAAQGPNLKIIKFIIEKGIDVNAKDINGRTSLHIAAEHGRTNIVQYFVQEMAVRIDDKDNFGKTPLLLASKNGQRETVEILLANNADVNIRDTVGYSALNLATIYNHLDTVKTLLTKEDHVDSNQATSGFTLLRIAAEKGNLDLVKFLIEHDADVNARTYNGSTPLHAATLKGNLCIVNILIEEGAYVNAKAVNGCTPLHYAIENGHLKIANVLLKERADVNAVDRTYNYTPLHYAVQHGSKEIVKLLLKYGANVHISCIQGITPLHFAALNGHLEIVHILLKNGVNICDKDKNNATALHYAASKGHKEISECLINKGDKIDHMDFNCKTPLHVAALAGQTNVADLLIRNKAKLQSRDIEGMTPLHSASVSGCNDIIDILIQNKAEINTRSNNGAAPLHIAALNGHESTVALLINYKAHVNATADGDITPLHMAVMTGSKGSVNILLKNHAKVNATTLADTTPLHIAVEKDHKEIVEILIEHGAYVNVKSINGSPLLSAIKYNNKDILKVLIKAGADIHAEGNYYMSLAVLAGYRDSVDVLLRNGICVNAKGSLNRAALHIAARNGDKQLTNILLENEADVNVVNKYNMTPLHFAAYGGHEEVMDVLISNGADLNVKSNDGLTPLHVAAANGHENVIKVLLNNKTNLNITDLKNRTPLELAVFYGRLNVVKILLEYKKVDKNMAGNKPFTMLHIAAQKGNYEMTEYLITKGYDINARNTSGSKPVHIAAREGHTDLVEFFLGKGIDVNDTGATSQTFLHYAAMNGKSDVVKYLIEQGANINFQDSVGSTPLHIATNYGCELTTKILLNGGAVYNHVDNLSRTPLETASDKKVINMLSSTEQLFKAVKENNFSEVEKYIQVGGCINAKNTGGVTCLHHAAWKGYMGVVNVLLRNEANPNAVSDNGLTPLHYAAKFSHEKVVKALLSKGAVYNALSNNDKTPLDLAVDHIIISLLKLLNESFNNIQNGSSKVINDLNKIADVVTIKAIMGAQNKENKTLVVFAVHNNFPKVKQLKEIAQGNVSTQIAKATTLFDHGHYQSALNIYKKVFEKRNEILGPKNPGTLDVQTDIAKVLFKQEAYKEALDLLEDIFQKQKEIIGLDKKDILHTRGLIALVILRQGKDEEALNIYQDVYREQLAILGPSHSDTLDTQLHMAIGLVKLGKYEEALNINRTLFEKYTEQLGENNLVTVSTQNNIAMILANLGKYEDGLETYKEVYEKRKIILGVHHRDTLKTLDSIAALCTKLKKFDEALRLDRDVLQIQKDVLGNDHPDTLNTQYNMANLLFAQNKWKSALRAYKQIFNKMQDVFGENHWSVKDITAKVEIINFRLKLEGSDISKIVHHFQSDIVVAASKGDVEAVKNLLKERAERVNDKNVNGLTPLHYAVCNGHINTVITLLKNGADVMQVSNKGNTPLHTAVSKGYQHIVEVILQHVARNKLYDLVNTKTTATGTTALHLASKNGSIIAVNTLLKHGAIYNIQNKEGKTALDLSNDQTVIDLLKLVDQLFKDAKNGATDTVNKLKLLKGNEFLSVTNTRNNIGNTLLQVAIANGQTTIASKLLEMLKNKHD